MSQFIRWYDKALAKVVCDVIITRFDDDRRAGGPKYGCTTFVHPKF